MRFWIVGGGTGGHIYPALAVADALRDVEPRADLTWIGGSGSVETEIVGRTEIPFRAIPAGGVHGVGPLRAVGNSWRLLRGWRVAMRMARRRRPAAVLTTGGYVSVPVALAVRSLGIPLLVYLPDIEPALSVKFVSRLAPRVAVTVEGSKAYLTEDKVTVTGYPLGERVRRWDRESGRGALGLPRQARVLLVFGGSRGARSINRAVVAHLEELLRMAEVVHVTGHLDWEEVVAARGELSSSQVERYHPFPYLHEEMGAALAAADLVVSRAGASVLGEFPYFGLPAVLVPYPYAWRYQRVNAAWLAERAAAVVVEDEALAEALVPTVRELLEGEERRAAMATSARELARPHAATHIAEALLALGKGR